MNHLPLNYNCILQFIKLITFSVENHIKIRSKINIKQMFKNHKTETASLIQLNISRPMILRKGENLFCLDNKKRTIFWYKMKEEITLVQTIKFSFNITAFTYSETLRSLLFQQGSNIKEFLLTEGERNINLNKCEHLQKRVRKISLENAKIRWLDSTTTNLFICYFKIEQTRFSWKSKL